MALGIRRGSRKGKKSKREKKREIGFFPSGQRKKVKSQSLPPPKELSREERKKTDLSGQARATGKGKERGLRTCRKGGRVREKKEEDSSAGSEKESRIFKGEEPSPRSHQAAARLSPSKRGKKRKNKTPLKGKKRRARGRSNKKTGTHSCGTGKRKGKVPPLTQGNQSERKICEKTGKCGSIVFDPEKGKKKRGHPILN